MLEIPCLACTFCPSGLQRCHPGWTHRDPMAAALNLTHTAETQPSSSSTLRLPRDQVSCSGHGQALFTSAVGSLTSGSLPPRSLAAQARQDIWPTCVQGRKDFCLAGQGLPVTLGVPCSRGSLLSGHSPLRALRSPRSMAGRHRWGLVRR